MGENRIGEFLRAHREQVRPADVGIAELGRRRVPGLRREELALLAGVSADYLVRLEQGRHQHPSEHVLDALSRALRLDDAAAAYLHQLARPAPCRQAPARAELMRPSLQALLDRWAHTPAFITGRRTDVLAANALATALNPACTVGNNMVRALLLDEQAMRELYVDYDHVAVESVGSLRATVGADLDDPRLIELVGELSVKSDLFRRLWALHGVRAKDTAAQSIRHPIVGQLDLRYELFDVSGGDGQLLMVYHAEPGSPSERSLALLGSIAASARPQPSARREDRSDD